MEIKVCVGSACYVKGSHEVIEGFQRLIKHYRLEERIILKASFCLGHCTEAVSVQIEETIFGVDPKEIDAFFKQNVLGRLDVCK